MVKAFASRAVDLGLIPSRVKPMTLKLVFTASLTLSIKGQCGEQASKLLVVPLGKILSGILLPWYSRQVAGNSKASSYSALIAFFVIER